MYSFTGIAGITAALYGLSKLALTECKRTLRACGSCRFWRMCNCHLCVEKPLRTGYCFRCKNGSTIIWTNQSELMRAVDVCEYYEAAA